MDWIELEGRRESVVEGGEEGMGIEEEESNMGMNDGDHSCFLSQYLKWEWKLHLHFNRSLCHSLSCM